MDLSVVLRRASISDSVAEIVLQRITSGVYKIGERLPTERQLAESLGVSRAGVREGLNRLQSMGLIVTVRGLGGGSIVQDFDSNLLTRALALMLKMHGVTSEQLIEARMVLAPEIAALAAQRATEEDIRALEDISHGIDGTRSDQAHRAMFAFHARLTEACGNPILKAAMTPILNLVEPVADLARRRARERSSPAEQSEILAVMQAVKARDPVRARASMVKYMERFGRALEALDVEPPWLVNEAGSASTRGTPSPP
jgi:GntR family transcriptional regulator, transcriptional repressor for pyruvate dehydrogenase complex